MKAVPILPGKRIISFCCTRRGFGFGGVLKIKAMQTVSFETAKELKDAGFPQPEEWVDLDRSNQWLMFYVEPTEEGYAPEAYSADRITDIRTFGDPCEVIAYAPTATDLIPQGWYLIRKPKDDDPKSEEWTCSEAVTPEWFHNDNPHEAAAQAWLFVKRNQSNV